MAMPPQPLWCLSKRKKGEAPVEGKVMPGDEAQDGGANRLGELDGCQRAESKCIIGTTCYNRFSAFEEKDGVYN
jgi:hypothetical protein